MFCSQCGKRIEDDSTFCIYCGSKLEAPVPSNGSTGETMVIGRASDAETVKMESAGSRDPFEPSPEFDPFAPKDNYIPHEEAPFEPPAARPVQPQQPFPPTTVQPPVQPAPGKKKKSKLPLIIVIVVVVVLVAAAAGAFFLLRPHGSKNLTLAAVSVEQDNFPTQMAVYVTAVDEDGGSVDSLSARDFVVTEHDRNGASVEADIVGTRTITGADAQAMAGVADRDVYCITYTPCFTEAFQTYEVEVTLSNSSSFTCTRSGSASYRPVTPAPTPAPTDPVSRATVDISCAGADEYAGQTATAQVTRTGTDGNGSMCILPDSATRRYTESQLSSLNQGELCIARNEIYARHGYKFKNEGLFSYFSTYFSNYHGTVEDQGDISLSQIERDNVELILSMENGIWLHLKTN